MIYTHVLKVAAGGTASPLDALDPARPVVRECRVAAGYALMPAFSQST